MTDKTCDATFEPTDDQAVIGVHPDACMLPAGHDGPQHEGAFTNWGDDDLPDPARDTP